MDCGLAGYDAVWSCWWLATNLSEESIPKNSRVTSSDPEDHNEDTPSDQQRCGTLHKNILAF